MKCSKSPRHRHWQHVIDNPQHISIQGRNFVSKSGVTDFHFVQKFWAGPRSPRGWGAGRGLTHPRRGMGLGRGSAIKKVHFGGYLMHYDILISKLLFAVHRMLQDCAIDSVSFSPTVQGGLVPLADDNSDSAHICLLSPPHASHPLPFSSFPSFSSPIGKVLIHCGLFTVHYGPTPQPL